MRTPYECLRCAPSDSARGERFRKKILRQPQPNPVQGGPRPRPPTWFNGVDEYERASGRPQRRLPENAAASDALFGRPAWLWHRRAQSVGMIMGSDPGVGWAELNNSSYGRFITAFRAFCPSINNYYQHIICIFIHYDIHLTAAILYIMYICLMSYILHLISYTLLRFIYSIIYLYHTL